MRIKIGVKMSNFEYLRKDKDYDVFTNACIEAENLMDVSYSAVATYSRRALELAVKWVFANDGDLKRPFQKNLASLISERSFREIIPYNMPKLLHYIQKLGNIAVHSEKNIKREEAVLCLRNLFSFTSWIDYSYSKSYSNVEFDENILGEVGSKNKIQNENRKLKEELNKKNKEIEELVVNKNTNNAFSEARKLNQKNREFKRDEISEKETRKLYIDLMIKDEGWIIGENCIEEVKIGGIPDELGNNIADYVLYDDNGKPLAVIEAKKTSENPVIGKQQAKLYADLLEKKYGIRPLIFFTNGLDYYFWDDLNYPERKVSGIYSKKDLEKLIFRRNNKKELSNTLIRDDITNRSYQKEAITAVLDSFKQGNRKALLVMATGSGKTRTAASIVDILTKCNWAKNILFLADRIVLVKQAKESFKEYLPNLSLCNLSDNKDDITSRMIFSTYPTMMNAIDTKRDKNGKRVFTSGHFDLIILDESHRSIYKKYQAIFDYFDAALLGLTATPKDEIDKNTYKIFELEDNNPTFAYDLDRAINDGYLVPFDKPLELDLKLVQKGLRYSELTEEEKEEFENTFDEDVEEINSKEFNRSIFNNETVDMVIDTLMERGLKVEGGDKLGKTIIFAVNQKHAEFIVERFNARYPKYRGGFTSAIYHNVKFADTLIDDFKTKDKYPQIAVSVDMLDTGIDVPEILNLVFFKSVKSKAKFWQMIGRGTRTCKDLFGPGFNKEKFLIFDCYRNFEFFEVNVDGSESKIEKSLSEKIFLLKVNIIKSLEHLDYQDEEYKEYRKKLVKDVLESIRGINLERFDVRSKKATIEKYSQEEIFENINTVKQNELRRDIAPLIVYEENDEMAKRFDNTIYSIQAAFLENKRYTRHQSAVIETGEELAKMGNLPQIKEVSDTIKNVRNNKFWEKAGVFDFEEIRVKLRLLIKLIDKGVIGKYYYTNFDDEINVEIRETSKDFVVVNNLENYKKRVNQYLEEFKDKDVIKKMRNNELLTMTDIKYLEKILFEDLGTKKDYESNYGSIPFLKMISQIVGMDREVVEKEFSRFLNNQELNSNQIDFVKKIIDYIVQNGSMEKGKMKDFPVVQKAGDVIELFKNKTDILMDIVGVIDRVNNRLEILS